MRDRMHLGRFLPWQLMVNNSWLWTILDIIISIILIIHNENPTQITTVDEDHPPGAKETRH